MMAERGTILEGRKACTPFIGSRSFDPGSIVSHDEPMKSVTARKAERSSGPDQTLVESSRRSPDASNKRPRMTAALAEKRAVGGKGKTTFNGAEFLRTLKK
jgi:hypothetical protein